MRILYVTDRLSVAGGADLHLRDVIGAFAERFPGRVAVAHGGRHAGAEPPPGVEEIKVRALGAQAEDRRQLARLDEALAAADVVHLQNVVNPLAIARAVTTGRAVVTVQDHRFFCPGRGKWRASGEVCLEPMSATTCAGCLADPEYRARIVALTAARRRALAGARLGVLSDYMARELAAVGLAGAEVIPPWCEVSDRGPRRRENDECFLLAGRLVAHKAPLEAARAHADSGATLPLRVAGRGPLEPELVALLGEGGMLGWLPRAELRRLLGRARALVFPTAWQEPFGIVAVEALAEGTPVVAMRGGGAEDWLDSGGCLAVERGDVLAMAEAIGRLDRAPELAARLGEAGRDFVVRSYARGPLFDRLHALYRRLARGA